jgi:tetratricopeptide (TPR) repeat protein
MRRTVIILLLVSLTGVAGFLAYTATAREAEYTRLIAQGEAALGADQTYVAIEAFSGAIALKGDAMLPYLKRGETYRRRGELTAALRDLRTASGLEPRATRPIEELGDVNYALERYSRAAESYEAYVKLDDRSAQVYYKLGLTRFRRGDATGAVTALQKAIAVRDRFPEAHYLLGLCLADQNQLQQAITAVERAVQEAAALMPAREELAGLYQRAGDEGKAIEQLEAIAALDPGRSERLVAVGLAYARSGRTDLAVVTLRRAAERYPADQSVYVALARTWLEAAEARRGDRVSLSKALEALDRVTRGPVASSEALTLLGRALLLSGDPVEAERTLQQATARLPLDPGAFVQLATASQRLGHLDTARTALLRYVALADDTEVGKWGSQIADLSLRLGNPTEAVRWLTRTIEIQGETPAALGQLADAQLRAGDAGAARVTIDRGLEKEPRNAVLLALKRRIPS